MIRTDCGNLAAQMHIDMAFTNSDEDLGFLNRQGVANMAINKMPIDREIGWDVEWLSAAQKAKCAEYEIELEMVALPVQTLNTDGSYTCLYAGRL